MTMIVAFHLGSYVLVAADKRETYQVNGEVVSIISDEIQKLVRWHGGVATGSGYVPLLHDFKERLGNSEIKHTDEIVGIAKDCSHNLPSDQLYWKNSTNWLFTYPTDGPRGPIVRLAFIKSESPENIRILEKHKSLIWAKMPDYDDQLSRLNLLLRPESDLSNLADSISYHLGLLAPLYSYVATVNSSVSPQFECFVHSPEVSGMVSTA
ncbi:hypothetical protein ACJJIE_03940 [Microbulbifer sp. TRSA001]|uniref:hypothetical protein n=1 Tax=unclassified Microbulbifer TaxID=2619833 RepID=UPI0024AD3FA0|nr:hypothetical protein [Microbulbifer sp. VAAF005]WHI46606.1 hypothetical protein P0078_23345 [Microbulbifer sp. VAAF005]